MSRPIRKSRIVPRIERQNRKMRAFRLTRIIGVLLFAAFLMVVYVWQRVWTYEKVQTISNKEDQIEVKINSDIPVDVYMMAEDDWTSYLHYPNPTFEDAKYSEEGITSTSFIFTVPDDQEYYLVIYNPNNSTATVDYEYTDVYGTSVEEGLDICFTGICIFIIVIIVIIILFIYFFYFKKKKKPQLYYQPQYPQQVPPPQQYPPQQLPGYPPQRPPIYPP